VLLKKCDEGGIIGMEANLVWKRRIYDSSTGERSSQSAFTSYNMLFDTHPANAAWPKRSKSFICANEFDLASEFSSSKGSITPLLPFDGVKIGVLGHADIWDLDMYVYGLHFDVFSLDSMVWDLLPSKTHNKPFPIRISYLQKLRRKDYISYLEGLIYNSAYSISDVKAMATFLKGLSETEFGNFVQRVGDFYSYKTHGGFLANSIDEVFSFEGKSECWFSGKCIIINEDENKE
jgi:hypothetical protein